MCASLAVEEQALSTHTNFSLSSSGSVPVSLVLPWPCSSLSTFIFSNGYLVHLSPSFFSPYCSNTASGLSSISASSLHTFLCCICCGLLYLSILSIYLSIYLSILVWDILFPLNIYSEVALFLFIPAYFLINSLSGCCSQVAVTWWALKSTKS